MVRLTNIEKYRVEGPIDKLEIRGQDVTASVAAALPGINAHPYISPLKLFLMHSGIVFPELGADNPVLRRGRILEPAVAEAVREQRPGWTITKNNFYFRDPELRLGATPDFHVIDANGRTGILQCKTTAPSIYQRDWDNGKEIPLWIILQATVERMLTGSEFALVAVLKVDAFDLQCAILDVPQHDGAEQRIVEEVRRFWDDVKSGNEPSADYSKDSALAPLMYPRSIPKKSVDLSGDNELPVLLDQREQLKDQIKSYENRVDEIDGELRFKLGDAERAIIPGWNVSWATQHRPAFTVAEKDIRVLRVHRAREK